MHFATLSGLLLVCTVALGESAPGGSFPATVKEDRTEVRCGPSPDAKMYVTNVLRRGDVVEVVGAQGDWLAIKPPPHSFSWINSRFVQRIGESQSWVVMTDPDAPVPVRIGSDQLDEKPNVEGTRVSRGSQVVARGKEQVADDGKWLPIDPPPGEVRYVRATAVERLNTAVADRPATNPTPAVPPVMATPVAGQGGQSPVTTIPSPTEVRAPQWNGQGAAGTQAAPGSLDELWNQAEAAEQAGRLDEAERLYADVNAKAANDSTHHALAMRALNRLQDLRNRRQGGTVSRYPAAGQDGRVAAVPVTAQGQPLNCYVPSGPSSCSAGSYTAARAGQALPPPLSYRGLLRRSGRGLNGYPLYRLEQSNGQNQLYLCGQIGLDLGLYEGRLVEVTGPVGYYGELCNNYMLAQQVTPLVSP
jgi:hypothetical protein